MVVITRRARTVLTPQPESQDLRELRERTRRILSRSFKFEPKAITPLWELTNPDPLISLFKPFSPVTAITQAPAVQDIREELRIFSWRRVLPVIAVGTILIAASTIWQAPTIMNRYPASLNQVAPKLTDTNLTSLSQIPNGSIVPSGTKLDNPTPAPASTKTSLAPATSTQPAPSGQTNLTSSQPKSSGPTPLDYNHDRRGTSLFGRFHLHWDRYYRRSLYGQLALPHGFTPTFWNSSYSLDSRLL